MMLLYVSQTTVLPLSTDIYINMEEEESQQLQPVLELLAQVWLCYWKYIII